MPEGIEGFELGIAGADRPEARRGKGQYVTFLDGQSEAVVTLRILSDDRYEIDESFELYLDKDIPDGNSDVPISRVDPRGSTIGGVDRCIVTISDDGDLSKPGPPRNFRLAEASGGSLSFTWDEPFDTGNMMISGYKIDICIETETKKNRLCDKCACLQGYMPGGELSQRIWDVLARDLRWWGCRAKGRTQHQPVWAQKMVAEDYIPKLSWRAKFGGRN
jgi:hypothetical protein